MEKSFFIKSKTMPALNLTRTGALILRKIFNNLSYLKTLK